MRTSLGIHVVLSLALAAGFSSGTARAESTGSFVGRVDLVGALDYNVYSQDFTTNSVNIHGSGGLGYGGGVLGDLGVSGIVGVETGALYLVRKINIDLGAGNSSSLVVPAGNMDVVHIPADVVIGLDDMFSLLGGVFDEIPLTSSSGNNNFGLGGGLRIGFPLGGLRLFVDARFNHGLTNQPGGFHTNDILGLVGISFGG